MKRTRDCLVGIIFLAIGVILALNAFNITNINLFFDGWWTLFIIIPCFFGVIFERDKLGNLIGLGVGAVLLLACRDVVGFDIIWKLVLPAILIVIGLKIIFKPAFSGRVFRAEFKKMQSNCQKENVALFSAQEINLSGQEFEGASLTSIFGGIDLDLRNASFTKDVCIETVNIFGGTDILLPDHVNVKTDCVSIFGGLGCKKHVNRSENTVTVYIKGTCIFGGAEIK